MLNIKVMIFHYVILELWGQIHCKTNLPENLISKFINWVALLIKIHPKKYNSCHDKALLAVKLFLKRLVNSIPGFPKIFF
jgi:hypothetical protein